VLLANDDGYWMRGLKAEDEWGFMYKDGADDNIEHQYPALWQELASGARRGQVMTSEGLFTFLRFEPLSTEQSFSSGSSEPYGPSERRLGPEDYHWYVMTFVPVSVFESSAAAVNREAFNFTLGLVAVAMILALWLYYSLRSRNRAEARTLELLGLLRIINRILRHDVKNRLTQIRWALENSGVLGKHDMVGEAHDNIHLSLRRIEQMKKLEEMAIGSNAALKNMKISDVVSSVVEGEEMRVELSGDAVVKADDALYSVMENLVRNTRRHGGVEEARVKVEERGDRVLITYSDQGGGMKKIDTNRIFQEGYFGGETGNTGLGLYIIKRTIERYGGKIRYEPNEPSGVRFIFDLPLAQA